MTQTATVNGAEALLELFRAQGTDYIFCSPIAAWAPLWEALAKRKATTNIETPQYLELSPRDSRGRSRLGLLQGDRPHPGGAAPHRSRRAERRDGDAVGLSRAHPHGDRLARYADPRRGAGLDPGPEWPTLLVDLAGPVRNSETVTKWAKEVKTGSDLAADVRRAWYFAESVPRGPTLLGVPFDILMSQVGAAARRQDQGVAAGRAPTDSLREVAELLMRSRCAADRHRARGPHAAGPGGTGSDRRAHRRAGVRILDAACT